MDGLIATVEKSIQEVRGEVNMTDQEKFEAFKKERIAQNEEKYGTEIREKYGEKVVEQSNKKFANMTAEDYQAFEALTTEMNQKLAEATRTTTPESELGQEVAKMPSMAAFRLASRSLHRRSPL